jgi:hypothetical protein
MDWDAIAGAKYEVLKLNGDKFDFVATTNDPTYTFTNLSVGNDNWFTVRAIDIATGVVSEKSRGINVEPLAKPVLTSNLPLLENFNDRKPANYTLSRASSTELLDTVYWSGLDGVKMSGCCWSPLWVCQYINNCIYK